MGTERVAGIALLAVACSAFAADLQEFSTAGLPRSEGIVVRVAHPAAWRRVDTDDPSAIAELRGPQGRVSAILQVGRGEKRADIAAVCEPQRAATMLQNVSAQEPGTHVTEVFARKLDGRPAFELRYERRNDRQLLAVHSLIVCLKDTRLLVSCAGVGAKNALPDIEPVCRQVLDSVSVQED